MLLQTYNCCEFEKCVHMFDLFYYKSIILLYNKQNRHKSKLPFIYIMVYDGSNIKVKIETSRRWMAI